ncbi:carbohydrate ABC transporter permease [Asanoa siamensis]|uniref:ABC transmembrane type-1 domain-containing protein n=1 Tax=Asanoa siamensis TaxID=926357 RepID=A0ABQ4CYV3_9ACTN|nr:carbohydrate ABC transporter permease [Asanoa siamensis]GIF76431.1 hypothetical protein Asi02nite_59490 [Asanoa siamensis]
MTLPRRGPWRIVFVAALVVAAVIFVIPFVWLVSASLREPGYVFSTGLLPLPFHPENYREAFQAVPLPLWLFNSAVVGTAAAVSVTLSSAWVAFGFAYFRFPGRDLLFGLVLATMMLPFAVTMIPTYLIWSELKLTDTQVPLWAGNLFGSAFYIFLLRQFLLSLPRELFEAARVDGASYPALFWRVAFPLIRPALLVVLVFEFKASWTDLVKPLIYLRDESLFTLPRGLKVVLDRFGVRRRAGLAHRARGQRHRHDPDDHRVLPRPAPLHRRHRDHGPQGLSRARSGPCGRRGRWPSGSPRPAPPWSSGSGP